MSELLATAISDTVSVEIPFRVTESIRVSCIRPHIMLSGELTDGDFKLTIKESDKIISETLINYTELNTIKESSEFARGYVRFDVSTVLNHLTTLEYTEYVIELTTVGMTDSATNNISILSDFRQTVDLHDDVSDAAYNIEIYTI